VCTPITSRRATRRCRPGGESGETAFNDWGDIAISGDGKRTVFQSILYGLVDTETHTIPCPQTPALIYLRDCP
jgi:hypothetical protein